MSQLRSAGIDACPVTQCAGGGSNPAWPRSLVTTSPALALTSGNFAAVSKFCEDYKPPPSKCVAPGARRTCRGGAGFVGGSCAACFSVV